jgi:hypothetical protein
MTTHCVMLPEHTEHTPCHHENMLLPEHTEHTPCHHEKHAADQGMWRMTSTIVIGMI